MSQSRIHYAVNALAKLALGIGLALLLPFGLCPQIGISLTLAPVLTSGLAFAHATVRRGSRLRRAFTAFEQRREVQ